MFNAISGGGSIPQIFCFFARSEKSAPSPQPRQRPSSSELGLSFKHLRCGGGQYSASPIRALLPLCVGFADSRPLLCLGLRLRRFAPGLFSSLARNPGAHPGAHPTACIPRHTKSPPCRWGSGQGGPGHCLQGLSYRRELGDRLSSYSILHMGHKGRRNAGNAVNPTLECE